LKTDRTLSKACQNKRVTDRRGGGSPSLAREMRKNRQIPKVLFFRWVKGGVFIKAEPDIPNTQGKRLKLFRTVVYY